MYKVLQWVTGAFDGHTAVPVCLKDESGNLWVGESGHENEKCRKQSGPTECGYYVMRYMYDIINNFPNSRDIGMDWRSNQDPYSPLEFDDIRNVFARYFIALF